MLSALHPAEKDGQCASKYKKLEHELNFCGMKFPLELSQVARFEKQNDISIDIYILHNEDISIPRESDITSKNDVSTQTNSDTVDKVILQNTIPEDTVRNSKQTLNMAQRAKDSRLKVENWKYSSEGNNNNDFNLGSSSLNLSYISSTDDDDESLTKDESSTEDEIDYENWEDPNKSVDR